MQFNGSIAWFNWLCYKYSSCQNFLRRALNPFWYASKSFVSQVTPLHSQVSYDLRSYEHNLSNCQHFNGVWTRDLAIPVRRSNQLSYEATEVGSWSFLSSNEPREEWMWSDIWSGSLNETCHMSLHHSIVSTRHTDVSAVACMVE